MKLYYSPGACSLSPHIILREAGYKFDLEKVDLGTKKTAAGDDFTKINPKGYVPVLQLDDGQLLTENISIDEYLADHKEASGLAPKSGSLERYRLVEWLAFISTEIHKQFGPLFKPDTPAATQQAQKDQLAKRFDYVNAQLRGKKFLLGDFSVADAYLFTVLRWTEKVGIDLSRWPELGNYMQRVAARPHVKAALEAEGLVH
ncbi:MAG TPA: glutathione transferase GstA [Burkholderiales bacterium]|nr:glutathione transferase GstA [Burkholderiales bacterium]